MNKILIVCMVLMALVIPVSAASNTVSIGTFTINAGETIRVPLMLNDADNVGSVVFNLTYDPTVLEVSATQDQFGAPGPDHGDFDLFVPVGNQLSGMQILNPAKSGNNIIIGYVHLKAVGNSGSSTSIGIELKVLLNGTAKVINGNAVNGLFTINPINPTPEVPTMILVAAGMISLIGIGRLRKK